MDYIFNLFILLMAYSNASLCIRFLGNFKIGLFSDFISSLEMERKRELRVLSVIFELRGQTEPFEPIDEIVGK